MICPHCGASSEHRVLETRRGPDTTFRRRRCGDCGEAFHTTETPTTAAIPKAARRPPRGPGPRGDGAKLAQVWSQALTGKPSQI